jgi:hypothetical protein
MPERHTGGKAIRQELLAWPTLDFRDFRTVPGPLQAISKQEDGRFRIIPDRQIELTLPMRSW